MVVAIVGVLRVCHRATTHPRHDGTYNEDGSLHDDKRDTHYVTQKMVGKPITKMSINIKNWTGTFAPPPLSDVRWRAFALLFSYLLLGITVLGFSRRPLHVFLLIAIGCGLDMLLNGLLKNRRVFPLSAMISGCSLAILLNWSYGIWNLFLPVFVCIASKYIFTLNGRHFYNPSLFAICFCILLGGEYVTLAPSYQWYGTAGSAWFMGFFVVTGALLLFVFKINRTWLILSFLASFVALTAVRATIMEHVIPWQTLFVGAVTSPAFYLFTFYMITDPATSPDKRSQQVMVGVAIAVLDFLFHIKFSLYTFFFAGLAVATLRYIYFLGKKWRTDGAATLLPNYGEALRKYAVLAVLAIPVLLGFRANGRGGKLPTGADFRLRQIPETESGLGGAPSNILNETDPRVAHVAKWILSVGDAAAVADVDMDGLPDLFLTQPLKSLDWRGKLFLNKGSFKFEKMPIPDLERYLNNPQEHGIPGFAYFLDYDNDGDKDLFVGFGFGTSHLFENRILPDKTLTFREVDVPFLRSNNTVCLAANSLDFNNDGRLDMLLTNTLHQYLPDYHDTLVPLNIFKLPQPQFEGDRRMFHFLHESWHNANNGGLNYLLLNTADSSVFTPMNTIKSGLTETRWSLAVGTFDINNDGFTDVYIANDFGRDDCYLNQSGKTWKRQVGQFYGDIGLDTYKGMNASVADLDGNGKEDVYISNVHHAMQAEGSLLWMNKTMDGVSKADFEEKAYNYNLLNTNRFGWGAATGDLDLNGWQDMVQANGMVDDAWDKKHEKAHDYWYYQAQIARTGPEIHSYADKWADIRGCYIYPNEKDRISLNLNGQGFADATEQLGFTHEANTRGVALADFDNDGDLDILVTNQFGAPFLYENEIKGHQWLGLSFVGNGKNTNMDAVGTKVWLKYTLDGKPQEQYREVRLVNGFMAMGDNRLLYGFGKGKVADIEVVVQWHNGELEVIKDLALHKYQVIQQSAINSRKDAKL